MATEYSLNLIKDSDPEMFSITGMDRVACEIKSMHFTTEEQIRAHYKKQDMSDHEIDAWIERARQLAHS